MSERRAHALGALGEAAEARGYLAEARRAFEQALALSRELDESQSMAAYLAELADVALGEGDTETARRLAEESAAIRRGRVGVRYLHRPLLTYGARPPSCNLCQRASSRRGVTVAH